MALLKGSSGSIEVSVGDTFECDDGSQWEIAGFRSGTTYSPESLGGAPIVACKMMRDNEMGWYEQFIEADGLVDWCGDSIACILIDTSPKGGE